MKSFSRRRLLFLLPALLCSCSESDQKRFLDQGDRHFQARAYDEAKADYMNVLRADPYNPIACARLGQIWFEEGAPWRAGLFLQKAVELSPDDSESRLRLAKVYQSIGNESKAREIVVNLLQKEPAKDQAVLTLTELAHTPEDIAQAEKALESLPDKNQGTYYLARANIELRKKDLIAAQVAIAEAIKLAPLSPEIHEASAFLALRQKHVAAAEESFKTAARLAPVRSPIQTNYAEFIKHKDGDAAAAAYLKTVTAKAPDFFPAWLALAQLAFAENDYAQAIRYLANIFSRDADNVAGRLLQSDVWLAQGEPEKALFVLKDLEKAHASLAEIQYRMAKAYLQEKKLNDATAAANQAVAKNPNLVEAILTKAEVSLETGNAAEATATLEDLLQRHPNLKQAQTLLDKARQANTPPAPQ